jgi:hypothetical protein
LRDLKQIIDKLKCYFLQFWSSNQMLNVITLGQTISSHNQVMIT